MNAAEETLAVVRVRAWLRTGRARAIRERAGLSQADIARSVGTDPAQVSRWETRKCSPVRASALRLAILYDKLEALAAAADTVASAEERGLLTVAPGTVTVNGGDW